MSEVSISGHRKPKADHKLRSVLGKSAGLPRRSLWPRCPGLLSDAQNSSCVVRMHTPGGWGSWGKARDCWRKVLGSVGDEGGRRRPSISELQAAPPSSSRDQASSLGLVLSLHSPIVARILRSQGSTNPPPPISDPPQHLIKFLSAAISRVISDHTGLPSERPVLRQFSKRPPHP